MTVRSFTVSPPVPTFVLHIGKLNLTWLTIAVLYDSLHEIDAVYLAKGLTMVEELGNIACNIIEQLLNK